jgi:tetratricopeptide (TPR) repeat protein
MPGAFAYHLHSFSAATLRSTNRHWAGPLLAKGATATMGSVYEPYLTGTPDLAVFTARLIYQGFTFGEAACASQNVASWQTTVVGDPLYRPFGRNPDILHAELARHGSKLIEWSWLRLANLNLANGKALADCVAALESLEGAKTSAVLAEKLGDLYRAQGKPASAVHAWQQALKLDPSPMQKLRLLLTLGEYLAEQNRHAEALEAFQGVISEQPQYPAKLGLCRKMLLSAQSAKLEAEIQKLESEIQRLSPPPLLPATAPTNTPAR